VKQGQSKKLLCALLCVCSLLSLCACGKTGKTVAAKYDSLESMEGISAGVFVGAIFDDLLLDMIPTANLSYYQSGTECIGALLEGKIDLTINEYGLSIQSVRQNPELTVLPYKVSGYEYGAIFGKNETGYVLCSDFNEFIRQTWSDESLAYLYNTWLADEDGKDIDYQSLPATNGTITVATDSVYYPLTFIRNGCHTGFEIELIYEYCKSRGYALQFDVYDFGGVLAAVSSGKADIGMSSVIITEERKESYYFSEPYASGSALLIIRKENAPGKYNHIHELDRKTIGIHDGFVYGTDAMASIVEPTIEYMNSETEILAAVAEEKLDAAVLSENTFDKALAESSGLISIGSIGDEKIGFALGKTEQGNALKEKLDEYIHRIKESGELEACRQKWLGSGEKNVDFEELKDINGTLRLAVSTNIGEPVCYYNGNKIVGFDVDLLARFAKEYGYALEITDYSFTDMLLAVSSGECDIGAANITITDERTNYLLFSEPFSDSQVLVIVKAQDNSCESRDFFTSLKNKIHRTLIEEDRYKLYLNGIVTTCVISLVSAAAGLGLGYLLFLLFRSSRNITRCLLHIYEWIINALPAVVVLMIFYYVLFGNSRISGVWVSVIAFTAIFSVTVFGLLKTCFVSVDIGQYEAAYALGYNKRETLHYVIIPQVMPVFLPPFKSEFMSLFKATSVVGYIAVQDITKISDIIRSRTYEAFFPLIITTIIYFIITALFSLLINCIEKKFDLRARDIDEILKGVR